MFRNSKNSALNYVEQEMVYLKSQPILRNCKLSASRPKKFLNTLKVGKFFFPRQFYKLAIVWCDIMLRNCQSEKKEHRKVAHAK